jgi:hypothetical protein
MLAGLVLLGTGFYLQQNQFLMLLGGFLVAISGVEIKVGKLGLNAPSKRKVTR